MPKLEDYIFYKVPPMEHGHDSKVFAEAYRAKCPAHAALPELEMLFKNFNVKRLTITLKDGHRMVVQEKN